MTRLRDDEERLTLLLQSLGRSSLVEPPDGTVRRAKALGDRLGERKRALGWLVELVFDSHAELEPSGVRSGRAHERRLLMRATGPGSQSLELDLRLRREPAGTIELMGQFLPAPSKSRLLLRGTASEQTRRVGPDGEFAARRLSKKRFPLDLVLESDGRPQLVFGPVALDDGE